LLTQWGANTNLYTKGNVPKKEDVTFVGQAYGARYNIIHKLIKEEIPVKVWGSNWNLKIWHRVARKIHFLSNESFQKIAGSTRISQETMIKIFQSSRINMNLSGASHKERNQIKGRNFEIPACGGFQLSEYVGGLENYFKIDREIVCYRNQSELIDKIKYYLSHDQERKAVAEAGYQRVLQEHTYQKRFNELFKKMQLL
jgi:spore maturation protein CgeB